MDGIVESIAHSVYNRAVMSINYHKSSYDEYFIIMERILLKDKLLLIKSKMDFIVNKLTFNERYLLEYKYFRRKKILSTIYGSCKLDYSERTYFRKQNELLSKLKSLFDIHGLTFSYIITNLSDCDFFIRMYNKIVSGNERAIVSKRKTNH